MTGKKDVLVIGAGPAGLVAAINLNREGFNVIVRDKQDSVGGEPGWHPSVHSTPVDIPGLWDYIGIDCSEAFVDTSDLCKMYMDGKDMGNINFADMGYRLYNTERGHRKSSLDSVLFRIAEKEGVNFEFNKPFKEDDFGNAPKGTIIATGLSPGVYNWLGIDCSVFAGYWAYTEIEKDYVSASTYLGSFSNEYGYAAAMNGIWYVLLFARKEVPQENLAAFKKLLEEYEARTFEKWHRFKGQTPKGPNLYHKDFILTGTLAGFVEPAFGFGITGALLSGKISAMAVTDPQKAKDEFKRFTDGIITHIARKRKGGYAPSVKMGDVWFDIE
ncbi:MAG: FAD-binding protein [Thermodesulfobacteriota bacterium]|nr:FAD-binding protein [Thermodesulfobacteriota bacterium]